MTRDITLPDDYLDLLKELEELVCLEDEETVSSDVTIKKYDLCQALMERLFIMQDSLSKEVLDTILWQLKRCRDEEARAWWPMTIKSDP